MAMDADLTERRAPALPCNFKVSRQLACRFDNQQRADTHVASPMPLGPPRRATGHETTRRSPAIVVDRQLIETLKTYTDAVHAAKPACSGNSSADLTLLDL